MYPFATKDGFNFKGALLLVALLFAAVVFFVIRSEDTPLNKAIKDVRAGRGAKALPVLEEMVRTNPDDPSILPWLAQAYLDCDRIAEGRTALDTAIRLHLPPGKLESVVLAYSNYYQKKNDFEEASKLFESLSSGGKGSAWDAEMKAHRAQLYISWAQKDAEKGDLEAAAKRLEAILNIEPSLDEPTKNLVNRRLSAYYRELAANAELVEKNDGKAIQLLIKSLAAEESPITRMDLAAIYFRQHKFEDAAKNYNQVVETDPNNLEARHRLVELFVAEKDYEKARDVLVDLVGRERSVENFQLLTALQLKLNSKAGAVRALEDACELRPDDLKLLSRLKEILLSWSRELSNQGRVDESISVKGHAERVGEMIATITKQAGLAKEEPVLNDPNGPRIALLSSRIWLARGSLTPEGEVSIKNVSANPAPDLSLNVVFFDKTTRRSCGTVTLPVATSASAPLAPEAERTLYFSCPTTVAPDHQLAVLIGWHGHVLKELPVVKQR